MSLRTNDGGLEVRDETGDLITFLRIKIVNGCCEIDESVPTILSNVTSQVLKILFDFFT
jgi:hypothetical protein